MLSGWVGGGGAGVMQNNMGGVRNLTSNFSRLRVTMTVIDKMGDMLICLQHKAAVLFET